MWIVIARRRWPGWRFIVKDAAADGLVRQVVLGRGGGAPLFSVAARRGGRTTAGGAQIRAAGPRVGHFFFRPASPILVRLGIDAYSRGLQ